MLKNKLAKKDFSKLKSKYDNPNIKDLPSTFITYQNKKVQIRLWKDVPMEIALLNEYIEDLLLKRKLIS